MGSTSRTTTNFILEFGDQYLRFWSNGTQVLKSTADDWVTATAYMVGNYVMESAIIYYCHREHTSAVPSRMTLPDEKWVAQEILEVPLPYGESDLREVQLCPINDIIYLCHQNYAVHTR